MRKLATDVLQDQAKYRALLAYRGDEAQQILDSLQVVSPSDLLLLSLVTDSVS